VCLARHGTESTTLKRQLCKIAAELDETSEQWRDLVEALSEIHHPATLVVYARLFAHPAVEVRKQAALSACRAGQRELVPLLLRLLADREVAHEARHALREYGARILGTLADVMKDPTEDVEIRRNIPRVLAHAPHQATVDILIEGMFDRDAVLADRAIRAGSKLRLLDASLRFDQSRIGARICSECDETLWYERALACLYPESQSGDRLARLLTDKIEHGKDTVFRLLVLILPPNTVLPSWSALRKQDRLKRANVAEYFDNVLPAGLRERVLALVEPRVAPSRELWDRRGILEALLKNPEPELRECAAGAIGREEPSAVSTEKAVGAK